MRSAEFLRESNRQGEWVYHASHVPDKDRQGGIATWLKSLIQRGLQPSSEGYMGPGVYFAYDPAETYYHVGPEDSLMLRAKFSDLVKLYGLYPDNSSGIQRSHDEVVVPGPVPANLLEVEYFEGEWWSLRDALAAETGH